MTESDMLQSDLRELLRVLDMPDHARSQSPHEVFQEALTVLRERAPYLLPPLTGIARCSQDNAATLYFDGPLSDDQLTVVHARLRAVLPSAVYRRSGDGNE
jgi:hypothetical protein